MHVLFLSDNFPPEVNAPATRTHEHCREWVKAGHQVTVITCAPNFPRGRVFEGYYNKLWQTEEIDGIRVVRVWSYIATNEGVVRRILDFTSYMIIATVAALFVRKVDIIVGTSPQFFTAVGAWLTSVFKWKPWIFELRDIWPESIRAVGAMRQSRSLDMLERLELHLYRRATRIVSVTRSFRENLAARGIDRGKIDVVTNGVNLDRFRPSPKNPALLGRLGLDDQFVAGYVGTHGMAHALDTLLEAAKLLRDDPEGQDIRILMIGDGSDRKRLVDRAEAEQLTNVMMLESVPREQVADYWSLLDVSIIHLRDNDLFRTVIPSKMFECMAMALPVLLGVRGEAAEILEECRIGLTFTPQDASALVSVLKQVRADADLRRQLSSNGPAAAARFDRRELAADMLHILERSAA